MHQHHDPNGHHDGEPPEEPLDAANQSLADALRASFGILKGIMVVLVVLYLVSNIRSIESHEQALVLRLGRLLPGVHNPGLVWALPFPIDEIVPLPTKKSNTIKIDSHTFHRREKEVGKPLSYVTRGVNSGLNPSLDGALLTADTGLVHARWKVTYKIDDVASYVSHFAGKEIKAAEVLIRSLIETVGIQVATEFHADEVIRTRVDDVQREMVERIRQRLAQLNSGIAIEDIEMFEPTPPIQIRHAFDQTQQAENYYLKTVRDAKQEKTKILTETAGAGYEAIIRRLDDLERRDTPDHRAKLDAELAKAEGRAGEIIKDASAYMSVVIGQIEADVQEYRTLVPEYERNAALLIERLWEQARQQIYANPGVRKIYRPPGLREFRVMIGLDEDQERLEEEQRLQEQEFDIEKLRPPQYRIVGPDFD